MDITTINLVELSVLTGPAYEDTHSSSYLNVDVDSTDTTKFMFNVNGNDDDDTGVVIITIDSVILKKILEAMIIAHDHKRFSTIIEIDGGDCFRLYKHNYFEDERDIFMLAINNEKYEVHIHMKDVLIISKLL